ncbi:Uncharacterised protein [Serratia plymuthica]|nr:Uncharacterised protein [Serratia plymuthica]VEI19997.1 Uncharacterised protein [Serratia plymuthica]
MAYTYDNPGTWKDGISVQQGDIFRVDAHDARNPAYVEGDYYRAQKDFIINNSAAWYPASGSDNDCWQFDANNWSKTSDVAVLASETIIYSNGLNMLEVCVYMTPKQGNAHMSVSESELKKHTTLVDYYTGEPLTLLTKTPGIHAPFPGPGWGYSQSPSEFTTDVPQHMVKASAVGQQRITFYVAVNKVTTSKSIGVIISPLGDRDGSGKVVDTINGQNSALSFVTLYAKAASAFSGTQLDTVRDTRINKEPASIDKNCFNYLYVYAWTMPSGFAMKYWEWEDMNGPYTWAQSCYYKTGYDDGKFYDRWLAAGSIFPPGNYPDLWLDNDIALRDMNHDHYSIYTPSNQILFTWIVGENFSWVYDISGLDKGHAVIVTDQYGNRYRMLFTAGTYDTGPRVTSTLYP